MHCISGTSALLRSNLKEALGLFDYGVIVPAMHVRVNLWERIKLYIVQSYVICSEKVDEHKLDEAGLGISKRDDGDRNRFYQRPLLFATRSTQYGTDRP